MRLDSHTDSSTGNIKSAPAKHGREHGHAINWKATSILTTSEFKGQLNLLEHAAITTLKPGMNIQHKGPSVNSCWIPLLPKIAASFHDIPTNMEIWVAACVFLSFLCDLMHLACYCMLTLVHCYLILPFTLYIPSLLMLPSADEDNDDVIESFWLYIFSVFSKFRLLLST